MMNEKESTIESLQTNKQHKQKKETKRCKCLVIRF